MEEHQEHEFSYDVEIAPKRSISLEDIRCNFEKNEITSSPKDFIQMWRNNQIEETAANKAFFNLARKVVRIEGLLNLSLSEKENTPQLTMAYTNLHN